MEGQLACAPACGRAAERAGRRALKWSAPLLQVARRGHYSARLRSRAEFTRADKATPAEEEEEEEEAEGAEAEEGEVCSWTRTLRVAASGQNSSRAPKSGDNFSSASSGANKLNRPERAFCRAATIRRKWKKLAKKRRAFSTPNKWPIGHVGIHELERSQISFSKFFFFFSS